MIQQTQQKNSVSPFLGSIGWKQECATKKSEIVTVDELSKLTNGVVFLYRNKHILANFGQIFTSFTPIGTMLWPLFCLKSWNPDMLSL